jgi:cation:H+ antiporter
MIAWLVELVIASYFLSSGAEVLSKRYGARFIGRTLLSVATTLPEIAIVIYASSQGSYGTAIGAGLGSNLLMMTLGLSLMLFVATTRLSKAPLKAIDVSAFRLDKIFLVITAVASAALFYDGYRLVDGIIFAGLFAAYVILAFREQKIENRKRLVASTSSHNASHASSSSIHSSAVDTSHLVKGLIAFVGGTIGVFIGAGPFIHSLQGYAVDIGISAVILSVIISPIAGEMPEKISMILLARKGAAGASIAVANVLGSKIMNNTLLLAVAVFGAVLHSGLSGHIPNTPTLTYQIALVTAVTLIAVVPLLKKEIGIRVAIFLAALYAVSIGIEFALPQDPNIR